MLRQVGRIGGFFTNVDDERDALSHFVQDARQAEDIGLLIGIEPHLHVAALRGIEMVSAGRDLELRNLAGLTVCTWPQIQNLVPDQAAMHSLVTQLRAGRAIAVRFWCAMTKGSGNSRDDRTLANYQNQFASAVSEGPYMFVCAYNLHSLSGAELIDILSIHPHVLTKAGIRPNALHSSPAEQSTTSRRIKVLDVPAPNERSRMRYECWPIVISTGRWQGEMYLRSFETGTAIPFLIDWSTISDRRPDHPAVMATVSCDRTVRKKSEARLRRLSETLELQVMARTAELAEANKQLRKEVAERGVANARLQELQTELSRASRFSTVAQVAGALAHEVAQPLGAAINYVNAARRFLRHPTGTAIDQARDSMNHAAVQVLRAGRLTDRVRELAGGGDANRQLENVAELIEEAISLADGNPAALHIEFFRETANDHLLVIVDAIQIQQVLVNLFRNAIEAMASSAGRELHVTAARLSDELVRIAVADSGPGVPRDLALRLFQPFATTKRDGMGLGLAICRSIIESHGGELWHEPKPGGGSVFCFTIPAAGAEANDHCADSSHR
jgi:signal transduction histidine kinase